MRPGPARMMFQHPLAPQRAHVVQGGGHAAEPEMTRDFTQARRMAFALVPGLDEFQNLLLSARQLHTVQVNSIQFLIDCQLAFAQFGRPTCCSTTVANSTPSATAITAGTRLLSPSKSSSKTLDSRAATLPDSCILPQANLRTQRKRTVFLVARQVTYFSLGVILARREQKDDANFRSTRRSLARTNF